MTTLITGATGKIGRLVVDGLLSRQVDLRALTRTPADASLPDAVEVVEGSLATPGDIFDGVDAVYLFPADEGADTFVERAVSAGVRGFVVLSSLAVSGRNARDAGSASARHHKQVEDAVTGRTQNWTILRPGNLANNLLSWAFPIRSGYPVRMPYAASSQVLLHEKDVAAAATLALTEPGHEGQVYELTGPAALSKIDQLAVISSALGRDVPWQQVTPDEFRSDVSQYISNDIIDMLLQYWSETVEAPEEPLPPVLGITPTTLADWAADHRADFGG